MSKASLSSTSLTNNALIENLQALFNDILQIQKENKNPDEDMRKIQEIITESSKAVEDSKSTNEIILDARILHNGACFVNSNVASFNTNLTTFNESSYIEGVLSHIETPMFQEDWKCLASATYHLFKKTHPLDFMLGTITLESPPPKVKVKGERQKKDQAADKKILTPVMNNDAPAEDTSGIYNHMLRCLNAQYKKNQKRPVSYFHFVIDPSSYWKTIENIFHVAFLVRDGIVKMEVYEGLPYVTPVKDKDQEEGSRAGRNNQFCCTLSVAQWKKCVQTFQIQSPSIPPYVQKG